MKSKRDDKLLITKKDKGKKGGEYEEGVLYGLDWNEDTYPVSVPPQSIPLIINLESDDLLLGLSIVLHPPVDFLLQLQGLSMQQH